MHNFFISTIHSRPEARNNEIIFQTLSLSSSIVTEPRYQLASKLTQLYLNMRFDDMRVKIFLIYEEIRNWFHFDLIMMMMVMVMEKCWRVSTNWLTVLVITKWQLVGRWRRSLSLYPSHNLQTSISVQLIFLYSSHHPSSSLSSIIDTWMKSERSNSSAPEL